QVYDPATDAWTSVSNLNVARSFIGGATVGQYVVSIGGYNGTTSVNTNEVNSASICATATPTPVALTGHVTWQNIPQANTRSVRPITLTLRMGAQEVDYATQNTDQNGLFTVNVAGL